MAGSELFFLLMMFSFLTIVKLFFTENNSKVIYPGAVTVRGILFLHTVLQISLAMCQQTEKLT
jgi:hypothetical protein